MPLGSAIAWWASHKSETSLMTCAACRSAPSRASILAVGRTNRPRCAGPNPRGGQRLPRAHRGAREASPGPHRDPGPVPRLRGVPRGRGAGVLDADAQASSMRTSSRALEAREALLRDRMVEMVRAGRPPAAGFCRRRGETSPSPIVPPGRCHCHEGDRGENPRAQNRSSAAPLGAHLKTGH